jgi:hypothetical protein
MEPALSRLKFHLEEALERSDDQEVHYHIRQALQIAEAGDE